MYDFSYDEAGDIFRIDGRVTQRFSLVQEGTPGNDIVIANGWSEQFRIRVWEKELPFFYLSFGEILVGFCKAKY